MLNSIIIISKTNIAVLNTKFIRSCYRDVNTSKEISWVDDKIGTRLFDQVRFQFNQLKGIIETKKQDDVFDFLKSNDFPFKDNNIIFNNEIIQDKEEFSNKINDTGLLVFKEFNRLEKGYTYSFYTVLNEFLNRLFFCITTTEEYTKSEFIDRFGCIVKLKNNTIKETDVLFFLLDSIYLLGNIDNRYIKNNSFINILIPVKGEVSFKLGTNVNNTEYIVKENDILIIDKNIEHNIKYTGNILSVGFDDYYIDKD